MTLVMEKEDGKRAIKGSTTGSKDNFLERKRRGSGAKSNGSNGSNGFNGSNGAAGGGEPGAWLNNNGSGPTNTGSYQREGLPRSGSRGWPSSRPSYGGELATSPRAHLTTSAPPHLPTSPPHHM